MRISISGRYELGVWTARIGRKGFQLRAPWFKPLYSERNALEPVTRIGFGWRVAKITPSPEARRTAPEGVTGS